MSSTSGTWSMAASVTLGWLLGLQAAACAAAPADEAVCTGDIDLADHLALLRDQRLDMIRAVYGIYEGPCGVLYLIDLDHRRRNVINESWWFYQLESAEFVGDRRDQIEVIASFATGIGPGGADPFRARIVMQHRFGGSWVAGEPEMLGPAPMETDRADMGEPVEAEATSVDPSVRNVRSAEALEALELESNGRRVELFTDFETSRVVIKSIWLTSGSNKIEDVQVRHGDDGYLVFYDVESPPIGTADMKRSLIYVVLPKDELPVSFHDRADRKAMGRRVKAEAVVIDRGGFKGAPIP